MLTENTLFAIKLLNIISNDKNKDGVCIEEIMLQSNGDIDSVKSMLQMLVNAKLISVTDNENRCYVSGKSTERVSLLELLNIINEELEILSPKNNTLLKSMGSSNTGIVLTTISTFVKNRLSEIKIADLK